MVKETRRDTMTRRIWFAALVALSPFIMAAKSQGCAITDGGGGSSGGDVAGGSSWVGTPDVRGQWALSWQDDLEVAITIGGTSYTETLGPQGGLVTIHHNGQPFSFDLDCSRDVVVCPSEVWPDSVTFDQDLSFLPRNVYVTIPSHDCDGELVDVDPAECGPEAESCQLCDGNTTLSETETIGRISFDNERLAVFLDGGLATSGVTCALLGLSVATADLETTDPDSGDYRGVALTNGRVITGFGGGCMWVADPDADGSTELLAFGASITFTTHFTGEAL
jgi:hypothetical protein